MTRPTFAPPRWATDELVTSGSETGETVREEPSSGVKAQGALAGGRVSAANQNWLQGAATDWLAHAVDMLDALMLRNWTRNNGTTGGYVVLYRPTDGYVYSFDNRDVAGSLAVRGCRFFPGDYVGIDTESAIQQREGLTIPNVDGGVIIRTGAVSSGGIMLVAGEPDTGAKEIRRSINGTTWTEQETGEGASILRSLHWCEAAGVFVAAFSGGDIHTSPDGLTGNWTEQTKPNANTRGAIASSPDRIIIADVGTGDADYVYADTDDITAWSAGDVNGSDDPIVNFAYSAHHGKWFAFQADGIMFASASGDPGSWSLVTSNLIADTVLAGRAFGRYLLAFGEDGLIRISEDGAASNWQNLTRLAEPPNGDANQQYGSIFVGDGIIVTATGENPGTGTDGTEDAVVSMTLCAQGFL